MLILIGGRNETISRSKFTEILRQIDDACSRCLHAILYKVQEILYNSFGYIFSGSEKLFANTESAKVCI